VEDIESLFELHGRVEQLILDDALFDHLLERGFYDRHAVSFEEILSVHLGAPRYFLNTGEGRSAPLIMVGPTQQGRFLLVPMVPSGQWGTWRPITAFEANTHHRARYKEEQL